MTDIEQEAKIIAELEAKGNEGKCSHRRTGEDVPGRGHEDLSTTEEMVGADFVKESLEFLADNLTSYDPFPEQKGNRLRDGYVKKRCDLEDYQWCPFYHG